MSKTFHKLYTIQAKGIGKAEEGIDDMLKSVLEALESQYPKTKLELVIHDLRVSQSAAVVTPVYPKRIMKA